MLMEHERIFRKDGTVRFVRYLKASGRRPAVVELTFRVPGKPALTTSYTVVERDFRSVYAKAIGALAEHIGVEEGSATWNDMKCSCDRFLARYKLRLVPVVYEQVVEVK